MPKHKLKTYINREKIAFIKLIASLRNLKPIFYSQLSK